MAKRGRRTSPPAAQKPLDASTGAPLLRKFMLKLFDREDGKAADWPLIAETLLAEAFHALDQSRGDARVSALLRRTEGGIYNRLADNPAEDSTPSRAPAADAFNGQALRPGLDPPKV